MVLGFWSALSYGFRGCRRVNLRIPGNNPLFLYVVWRVPVRGVAEVANLGQTKQGQTIAVPSLTDPLASAWVSQIGRVSISSSATTTTSPIEDYADRDPSAVSALAANVVLVCPPANEWYPNLERPPHPSCGLPQAQESPSVHRQLQRSPGSRSRRRNPRSHRHRRHSPAFNRIPSDIANPRLLHLLSATCLLRPRPN